MNDDVSISADFRAYSARKIRDHHAQIVRCSRMLSLEQLWFRPNAHSNSVGNLLLHLRGNIRQWIIGGVGGRPFERNRQGEFDHREPIAHDRVLADLAATIDEACRIIEQADPAILTKTHSIQKYRVTGMEAIYHVVEHLAFHTGQIVTTTKWLLDVDLSLYDEKGHRRDGRQAATP